MRSIRLMIVTGALVIGAAALVGNGAVRVSARPFPVTEFAQTGALFFDGQDDYVTMGVAPELGLTEFTLEAWIRVDGNGKIASTAFHGVKGYPILAKGYGTTPDGTVTDFNYFLAVRKHDRLIVADLESTMTGFATGMNHPIVGATSLVDGTWRHVAVTYDGVEWRMYLDGVLDMWTVHKVRPQSESIQHFSVGAAIDENGGVSGAFKGAIDEVRVWNHARTEAEIRSSINTQLTIAPGLVGSWTFDEGAGSVALDSSGHANDGTISGATWVDGPPLPCNLAPDEVIVACPSDGARVQTSSVELEVDVADPEDEPLFVTFQVRPRMVRSGVFTIAVLPDTQHYVRAYWWPEHFDAMTQWLVDHHAELNLRYVSHVGDIVQGAVNINEWEFANHSMSILDSIPALPYGLTVGNHDQYPSQDPEGTENFNLYFPVSRYEGVVPWYGGHFGNDNDNHYILFEGGGREFIGLHIEFRNPAPAPELVDWMNDLLDLYPNRWAIVTLHEAIMPGGAAEQAAWDDQGLVVYEALKHHPRFFLMLAGHRMGEGRRVDTHDGRDMWTLMHNPQIRPEGGEGFLRLLEFAESDDEIRVRTYSPVLGQHETDPDSAFTMGTDTPGGPWSVLDTVGPIPNGGRATSTWTGLDMNRTYEWRVIVSDGGSSAVSAVRTFRTTSCTLDLTDDGLIDFADLARLIDRWGDCAQSCSIPCNGDADADGRVGFSDLLLLLGQWGACPGSA